MGFYVSGHPLDDFAAEVSTFGTVRLGQAEGVMHESDQTAIGIVTEITRRTTKSGRPIAFVTLEDTTGQAEVVLFAQTLERCGHMILLDEVMMVKGKAETSTGGIKLIAKDVLPMWRVREQLVKALTLRIDVDTTTEADVAAIKALCDQHPGLVQDLLRAGVVGDAAAGPLARADGGRGPDAGADEGAQPPDRGPRRRAPERGLVAVVDLGPRLPLSTHGCHSDARGDPHGLTVDRGPARIPACRRMTP